MERLNLAKRLLEIILYNLFTKKITLVRWQLNLFGIICISVGLITGSYLSLKGISSIFASSSPWTQTDWVGGSGQTSWSDSTKFSTSSNISTASGQLALSSPSGWSDMSYKYRKPITLTNAGSTLTDYQASVSANTLSLINAGKMQSDCDDIRFYDSDNVTSLSYWIESGCSGTDTRFWVKIPSIPNPDKTIYMYYGNSGAATGSNGTATLPSSPLGTGGTITYSGNDRIHTFTGSGTFTELSSGNVDYLVVAGGAGAMGGAYGGGGAGGMLTGTTAVTSQSYSIQVGAGGLHDDTNGGHGGDSSFSTITATGGGCSAGLVCSANGGSGGGGRYSPTAGGTGIGGQGYAGGTGNNYNTAGGGGAGAVGGNASACQSGNGGAGAASSISGSSVTYAGGGGGGADSSRSCAAGTGGSGGGGNGGTSSTSGGNGTPNTGSGGGGGANTGSPQTGGNGGSGIVIVRYFFRTVASPDPTASAGSEEERYSSSGTLTSSIFDSGQSSDWGTLTYNTDGVATTAVKARTSNSSSMTGAADFSSCNEITSGTDISSNNCVTDTHRYIQYQVALTSVALDTPAFQDISIAFTISDIVPPTTNASSITMTRSSGGSSVSSNGWTNNLSPYFSWTAGDDNAGGRGVKGYCLYIGTDSNGDPATSKGLLGTSPVSTSGTTCQFIASGTSIDLATDSYKGSAWLSTSSSSYYLNIKVVDNAGNIFTGSSVQFQFRFDNTAPANASYIYCASGNFSNVADMNFNWPTSGSTASSDSNSGILGWQYQINSTSGTWLGTTTESSLGLNNYIPTSEASRTLTLAQDGSSIVSGNNIVYFRTADAAGNISSDATIRTCNLSYGGAAPSFGGSDTITVTPSSSTSNSYALSWPAATAATGQSIARYYYMVNTQPPSTLATLQGNATTYIDNGASRTVSATVLSGANKGSNTVYVVAIDNASTPNYSPSNYISGVFTLNSTDPDNPGNLVASDSSIKSQSQWNVTLTWTAPSYQGAGNLTYRVYRSTDGTSFSLIGTTSGLSYVDNTPSSLLYYYKVYTRDGANSDSSGTNAVSITPTGKWTSAPSLSTGPDVGSITTKKATITWSTSRSADSKVQYGTTSGSYGSVEPSNSSQVTSHSIQLTGLNPGTKYYYKTKWTDEDGNTGTSDEKNFTTASAPSIKDVSAKNIGLISAIIQFTSKEASKVKIYYGATTGFGAAKEISTSTSETTYTTELTGLLDGTKYYYKINKYDSENAEYEGDTYTFETLPRPKISKVRIQQVANTAQSTILVTWTTNTDVSSIITYYAQGNSSDARDEVNVALTKGEHRMIVRGLAPKTDYILIVKGRDRVGNEAVSDSQKFTTATDTRPPQISKLNVEGSNVPPTTSAALESTAQLIVSWNTDEPSTSQVEFGEGTGANYSSKTQEDGNLTYNHLVIISGLTPSKVYHLRTISKDIAGNIGNSIDTVTITPKTTENALNLVITNLQQAFGFIGNLKR